ncbi:hypothetical protein POVWA2_032430 [Plasmodium ovale wallikeri]|uniref:Uncharacterized protein n=1 Tax=Plasmodium ovale wallikeri TaxID=864142 RepID=A0A1A8YXT5_PLAOA|nr:hypothetical protein POVWA1_032800 [Plasmodium ovale wallikeri]SBT36915.1 hypothetical protein POVWA2_032430 [Plasmodium ovale wallikeri]
MGKKINVLATFADNGVEEGTDDGYSRSDSTEKSNLCLEDYNRRYNDNNTFYRISNCMCYLVYFLETHKSNFII